MSIEDKELDEMFHGEEKPIHPDTVHINLCSNNSVNVGRSKKETTTTPNAEKPAQMRTDKPRDAKYEPVPCEPTQIDRLKECAKSALLFGGLSLLFFWFQQTDQMAMGASMFCIIACVALGAFCVGRNFGGGK